MRPANDNGGTDARRLFEKLLDLGAALLGGGTWHQVQRTERDSVNLPSRNTPFPWEGPHRAENDNARAQRSPRPGRAQREAVALEAGYALRLAALLPAGDYQRAAVERACHEACHDVGLLPTRPTLVSVPETRDGIRELLDDCVETLQALLAGPKGGAA